MEKNRLPKTQKRLEKAYENCIKKGKFKEVDKESFHDYLIRSQKDILSAENDLKNEDFHWTRIKAYQSLFHMLNAILIKKLGFYSKDHSCILTALLNNNIITKEISSKMNIVIESITNQKKNPKESIQDIDDLRIQRNFALYKPKAWEEITKKDIQQELIKIKHNLNILASLL